MKLKVKLFITLLFTTLISLGTFSYVLFNNIKEKSLIPLIGHRMDLTSRNASLSADLSSITTLSKSNNFEKDLERLQKETKYHQMKKMITLVKRQNELEKDIEIYSYHQQKKLRLIVSSNEFKQAQNKILQVGELEQQALREGLPLFGSELIDNKLMIYGLSPIESRTAEIVGLVRTEFDATVILSESSKEVYTILLISAGTSFFLLIFVAWPIGGYLTQQVDTLADGAQEVAKGNLEIQLPIKTGDELGSLTLTFNQMISTLKDQREEIENYSKNLEILVQQRTRELNELNQKLQTMLDNLSEGIFTFKENLVSDSLSSLASQDIFSHSIANKNIVDILQLTESEQKWAGLLFDEPMPFQDLVPLGPTKKVINHKHISLKFIPIRVEEKIDQIMVVATDKTNDFLSEKRLKEQEESILEIIHIFENRSAYMSYIQFGTKIMTDINQNKKDLFDLHTLKGGALLFGHKSFANTIHNIEENDNTDHQQLTSEFEKIITNGKKYFGQSWEPGTIDADISTQDLVNFIPSIQDSNLRRQFIDKFLCQNFKSQLNFLQKSIELTAQRNDKLVSPLRINGGDIRFYPLPYQNFLTNLVHPINNAVIHGIESKEEREAKGKPVQGQIEITINQNDQYFVIEINDDGRGFEETEKKQNTVKIDAGRGVGKQSFENAITSLGGSFTYHSEIDQGVKMTIELPIISPES